MVCKIKVLYERESVGNFRVFFLVFFWNIDGVGRDSKVDLDIIVGL